MQIIGITGSIGCGKTFLASILQKAGYCVYNPDFWVRDLYKKADFLRVIEQNFPQVFNNGEFNKRKLRELVFNDNKQLKKLESLIHPFLNKKLKKIIKRQAPTEDFLFLDVALLLEMGWDKYCDYILVAYTDDQTQMHRVMERDHISAEDFKKIVAVQMPKDEKNTYADVVIETNLPENILKVQLLKFIEEIS